MQITLLVPEGFILPPWFSSATEQETASALDVAGRLCYLSRDLVDSASSMSRASMRAMLGEVLSSSEERNTTLSSSLSAARKECANKEIELREKAFILEQERSNKAEEVARRVQEETISLTRRLEEMERARDEDLKRAEESGRSEMRQTAERAQVALMENMREGCHAKETFSSKLEEQSLIISSLREKVAALETPMGKGRSGELVIHSCAEGAGLQVVDTSTGSMKDNGYLDLLIFPDGEELETSCCRIAVEVKNVAIVEAQHLRDFEDKVKKGIEKNMWDAAVFLSIRSHTKKGSPVCIDLLDKGNHVFPVTWLGTEKGRNAAPLLQEQVETHFCMITSLLRQMQKRNGEKEANITPVTDVHTSNLRVCLTDVITHMNDAFSEMGRQHRLIEDMRSSLTSVRVSCIRSFLSLWSVNRSTPWLGMEMDCPWMDAYQAAKTKMDSGMDAARTKTLLHRSKALLNRTVGQDAMFLVLKRNRQQEGDRKSGEEDEGDEELACEDEETEEMNQKHKRRPKK